MQQRRQFGDRRFDHNPGPSQGRCDHEAPVAPEGDNEHDSSDRRVNNHDAQNPIIDHDSQNSNNDHDSSGGRINNHDAQPAEGQLRLRSERLRKKMLGIPRLIAESSATGDHNHRWGAATR